MENGNRCTENAGGRYVETRYFDTSRHYLFPIPQAEIDLNENLKQNPNW